MSKNIERSVAIQTLIRRLREERLRQGLSQNEVAARAGFGNSVVLRMEKGERLPGLNTLLAISDALGVDLGHLLSESVKEARSKRKPLKAADL